MSSWLKILLSGPDNTSPAIGRVLGALVAIVIALASPTWILFHLISVRADASVLFQFLSTVGPFEVLIIGAITALIFGTSPTEPKPPAS